MSDKEKNNGGSGSGSSSQNGSTQRGELNKSKIPDYKYTPPPPRKSEDK